jgi:hypothetical protein
MANPKEAFDTRKQKNRRKKWKKRIERIRKVRKSKKNKWKLEESRRKKMGRLCDIIQYDK